MDASFELASTTPIALDDLREAAAKKRVRSRLYDYYVAESTDYSAQIILGSIDARDTLEALGADLGDDYRRLFAVTQAFKGSLGRNVQKTTVPGHGTVAEVSVADGPLQVHQNLLVEGTLLVPGDVTVGGQVVVGDSGVLIVAGALHAPAIASAGQICVGKDLRAMFIELAKGGGAIHVGGELDGFLLIQDGRPTLASSYSVGLHAVLEGKPSDVFLEPMLDHEGRPDWNRVAQAAQDAEDVFQLSYRTPVPGEHELVELIET